MKQISLFLVLLIISTVSISGCETKTANQTWGEQKVSPDLIKTSNNTTGEFKERNNTGYYVVTGYLINQNPGEAFDIKMNVSGYDANNTLVSSNTTPYINPKSIPGRGQSYFGARLKDPEHKIVRFEVKILGAHAQIWSPW